MAPDGLVGDLDGSPYEPPGGLVEVLEDQSGACMSLRGVGRV